MAIQVARCGGHISTRRHMLARRLFWMAGVAVALLATACKSGEGDFDAERGTYDGWFEDLETGLLPMDGTPALALDYDGSEVVFGLLEPTEASCIIETAGADYINYFSLPQSFTSVSADVDDGSFSFTSQADVVGDLYNIEVSGEWTTSMLIEGTLSVDMGQRCVGDWAACLEGEDCTADACSDEPATVGCEWYEDANCWTRTVDDMLDCLPSTAGDLDSSGTECTFSNGTSVLFDEPVTTSHMFADPLQFNVLSAGVLCFTVDYGGSDNDDAFTLTFPTGEFTYINTGSASEWQCPNGCSYASEHWDLVDCPDVFRTHVWGQADDEEFTFRAGTDDMLGENFVKVFRCEF